MEWPQKLSARLDRLGLYALVNQASDNLLGADLVLGHKCRLIDDVEREFTAGKSGGGALGSLPITEKALSFRLETITQPD
jgi:hypothetical protein